MAAKKSKRIVIDHTAKTIEMYQRVFENLSEKEEENIFRYQNIGYELTIKENPKARTGKRDTTKDADIRKALEKDEAALAKYDEIKSERNFFAAKSWYLNEYKKNKK